MSKAVIVSNVSIKISGGGVGGFTTLPNEYAEVKIYDTGLTFIVGGISFQTTQINTTFIVPPSSSFSGSSASYIKFRNAP